MAFGGYAVKFYQNAYDTTQITGQEFRQYSWELSLYFTAAVEGAIVCFLLVIFITCNAFDACWLCTQCCCTHFICTPLVHYCCLSQEPPSREYANTMMNNYNAKYIELSQYARQEPVSQERRPAPNIQMV